MSVRFVSREDFIEMLYIGAVNPDTTACISISCTPEEQYEMHNHFWKNYSLLNQNFMVESVLTLNFFDDDTSMSDENAKRIVKFIDNNRDKEFLVHCLLGVSRSGAVAKFINEYLERDIDHINNYKAYNVQVFNKLNAAIGNDLASYYAELEKQDRPSFSR